MDIKLFSDQFDVLLNSYLLTPPDGTVGVLELNEYEKSVFLTEALNVLVKDIYSGRNTMGISYESTEEARRYLAKLVNEFRKNIDNPSTQVDIEYPNNLWFITYEDCSIKDESAGCADGNVVSIVPIRLDDFYRIKRNPFRGPSENRVLRVDVNNNIRLISKYKIGLYHCFYLHMPTPIILTNLGDLNISGYSQPIECGLNSNLHDTILLIAVKLALVSKAGLITNNESK